MIDAPHMLLIGGIGRDCGKTTLACALIARFRETFPINAAKITIHDEPPGAHAPDFEIIEETNVTGPKDTQRMLAAGAQRAWWIVAHADSLEDAAPALLERLGSDSCLICESGRLRTVIRPGLFLMVGDTARKQSKPSAQSLLSMADCVIITGNQEFNFDLSRIEFADGTWRIGGDATWGERP